MSNMDVLDYWNVCFKVSEIVLYICYIICTMISYIKAVSLHWFTLYKKLNLCVTALYIKSKLTQLKWFNKFILTELQVLPPIVPSVHHFGSFGCQFDQLLLHLRHCIVFSRYQFPAQRNTIVETFFSCVNFRFQRLMIVHQ